MRQIAPLLLQDIKGVRNSNHERSSTRVYLGAYTIDCDENYVLGNVVVVAGNQPVRITDPHPTDGYQFVMNMNAELLIGEGTTFIDDSPNQAYTAYNGTACYYWRITIEFGPFNPLEQSPTGSMTDIPTRIQFEDEEEELPLYNDYYTVDNNGNPTGKPCINSAYDWFNPGITRLYANKRLIVMRNEASNPTFWNTLINNGYHTNKDPWNGYPARTVLFKGVRSPSAKYAQVTGSYYYEMQYNFYVRALTWDKFVLDQGFNMLGTDESGNVGRVPILKSGVLVPEQVPLNGNGEPLGEPVNPGDLVLLQFQAYPTCDFSTFNMDSVLQIGVPS